MDDSRIQELERRVERLEGLGLNAPSLNKRLSTFIGYLAGSVGILVLLYLVVMLLPLAMALLLSPR